MITYKNEYIVGEGERYYVDNNDTKYLSVTSLLSRYEDKKKLIEWRNNVGDKEADKKMLAGQIRGKEAHKLIEHYYDNSIIVPPLTHGDSVNYAQRAIDSFYGLVDFIDAEQAIFYQDDTYPDVRVAGRYDTFVSLPPDTFIYKDTQEYLDDGTVIVDLKTKTQQKNLIAPYMLKNMLQGSCYVNVLEKTRKTEIQGFVVVYAAPKSCRMFYLNREKIAYFWSYFESLLFDFYGRKPLEMNWTEFLVDSLFHLDKRIDEFVDNSALEICVG